MHRLERAVALLHEALDVRVARAAVHELEPRPQQKQLVHDVGDELAAIVRLQDKRRSEQPKDGMQMHCHLGSALGLHCSQDAELQQKKTVRRNKTKKNAWNLGEMVLEAEHPHKEAVWLASEIHQIDLNSTKKTVGNQGLDARVLHLRPLLCTCCTQLQEEWLAI
jgi:hypothetical protein